MCVFFMHVYRIATNAQLTKKKKASVVEALAYGAAPQHNEMKITIITIITK